MAGVTAARPMQRAAAKPRRRVPIVFRLAIAALAFVVLSMFANEFSLMGEARRVAADVSTRELDQLGDVFTAHKRPGCP